MYRKKFLLKNIDKLQKWVGKTAKNARGLLVPVSGGTDSALTLWLLMQVYPEKTLAVFVGEKLRAKEWFSQTNNGNILYYKNLPGWKYPEIERNALFQRVAADIGFWLVGTRNRTEQTLGNFSLASRVATYLPIAGVWKTEVIEMCRFIGIPEEVIVSSSRADPDCGRPSELAEISLEHIDLFVQVKEGCLDQSELAVLNQKQIKYLEELYGTNQFRRYLPVCGPNFK